MKLIMETINKDIKISDILRRAHDNDAALDVVFQEDIVIKPGKNIISLGFKCILPPGIAAYIFPRSSIMGNGLQFNLAPIDPDYSGEYHAICYNASDHEIKYEKGDRICQIVFMPFYYIEPVDDLPNRRSDNGIGSTYK